MAKKGKGSKYEREICRKLSLWWTNDKHDDCFWRSSMSGGRATVRSRKGLRTRGHHGDICATDKVGQKLTDVCTIEVKRGYNKDTIHDCLDRPKKAKTQTFEGFFRQAIAAAKNAGTPYWLLIHKRDRREPLVFFSDNFGNDFVKDTSMGSMAKAVCLVMLKQAIIGIRLSSFLKRVDPNDLRRLHKQRGK